MSVPTIESRIEAVESAIADMKHAESYRVGTNIQPRFTDHTTKEERSKYLTDGICLNDDKNDFICRLIDDVNYLREKLDKMKKNLLPGRANHLVDSNGCFREQY